MFGRWAGRAIDKLPQHLARLAKRYGVAADAGDATRLLFALQTYYAVLVNSLAERFAHGRVDGSLPGNPFSWPDRVRSKSVGRLIERMTQLCAGYRLAETWPADDGDCDLFKPLYQDLFPRPLRRQLGEYYTPDWLAAHVLDQVGYTGQLDRRLLDPACGSGTFLLMALRRLLKGEREEARTASSVSSALRLPLSPLPSPLVGFDLNPLAVMTARANYRITLAEFLPEHAGAEAPIYLYDSILGRGDAPPADCEPFDVVVGNPPWIAWDNLPEEDRRATMPLWKRYGLFSLSGNEARHGGGKKDLSMLMLYAAADRYLKPGGRLGMVITQTLFQTKGAGDGFRRFQLGANGPPLKVLRVDDMVALRPFGDAANWTSTIVLEKGAATTYPVPYFKWGEGKAEGGRRKGERRDCDTEWEASDDPSALRPPPSAFFSPLSPLPSPLACLAHPIDPAKPTSPWLVQEIGDCPDFCVSKNGTVPFDGRTISRDTKFCTGPEIENSPHPNPLPTGEGTVAANCHLALPADCVLPADGALPADYVAHLGANSGGANGVYWLEVLGESDGGVLIRNMAARGKHRLDTVEHVIEPDLLYPLLRWGDVGRYSAVPRAHLLLAQDPATRAGIDETIMRAKYPRTLAYLERFRDVLASRAAYRRYQQGGPFYAMYNIGLYTVAPIKVVWRRMDRRINAAVVESCGASEMLAPRDRPMIPQETCVLVACDSSDEAHYLCAMLNSAAVNERVAGHSVCGGKSFGTPGMFDFLPLRRYRPDDPRHVALAQLSRQSHAAPRSEFEHCIDEFASLPLASETV